MPRPGLPASRRHEHDLIVERTQDGLAAARARGRKSGGRVKMTPTKAQQARTMYDQKIYRVQEIAETLGVSRGTIYRHLSPSSERS
ncbi:MAG TPA: helix-turn-helix domain-containing protein [Paenarthrobacter sp.]|nr:helix-turn-helix domain-containing protein [Paenarthrobacter sp.]